MPPNESVRILMNPKNLINDFLDQIRKRLISAQIVNGTYLFLTTLTSGLFIASIMAYFCLLYTSPSPRDRG